MLAARKTFAVAAVAALLAAAFPLMGPAAATSHGNDDIQVTEIRVAPDPPVLSKLTFVNVTIRNTGSTGTGAVQINLDWVRADGKRVPLQTNDTSLVTVTACRPENDPTWRGHSQQIDTSGIPRNEAKTYTFCWKPTGGDDGQATKNGRGQIIAIISTLSGTYLAERPRTTIIHTPGVNLEAGWTRVDITRSLTEECRPQVVPQTTDCKIRPGETVVFHFQLANTGNYPDAFDLKLVPESLPGWKIDLSADSLYVLNATPENQTRQLRTLSIYVTAPEKGEEAKAGEDINDGATADIRVRAVSQTLGKVMKNLTLPRLEMAKTYDLNLTNYRPVVFGNVTELINLNASLGNDGNVDDYFKLRPVVPRADNGSMVLRSKGWEIDVSAVNGADDGVGEGLKVAPFERRDAIFAMRAPENVTRGTYWLTMEYYSTEAPSSQAAEATDNFTYKVVINQTHILEPQPMEISVDRRAPAETSSFPLVLWNRGNGPDNVTYQVFNVPGNWRWTLEPLDAGLVRMEPRETRTLWFNVTTPPGEEKDKEGVMWVNFTGQQPLNGAAPATAAFRTRVVVLERSSFTLTTSPTTPPFVDPGQSVTYQVTMQNVGNKYDNFTLDATTVSNGWTVTVRALDGAVSDDTIYLAPPRKQGAPNQGTALVTFTAPSDATVGDIGRATLTIRSKSDLDVFKTRTFEARVSGPDLELTSLTTDRSFLYEGEGGTIRVGYANRGNKDVQEATLTVVLNRASGSPVPILTTTVTGLSARSSGYVEIPHDLKDLAGAGTLAAAIDPSDAVKEIQEDNNQKSLSVFVRTWGVKLDGAARGLTSRPGERVAYLEAPNAFVLRNDGNALEVFDIRITSEHGWIAQNDPQCRPVLSDFALEARTSRTFCVAVNVPELPGVQADRIQFVATSKSRPNVTLSTSLLTTVIDEEPPRIHDFRTTPGAAVLGQRVNVSARILDAVGVQTAVATIKRADGNGTEETLELYPGPGNVWSAEHVFDATGEYLVRLTVSDRSATPNVNTTRLNFLRLTVTAGSAPYIDFAGDVPQTIRAGTPIPFTITDKFDLQRVWYVANGVQGRDLVQPYRLDTSQWKDGRYNVLVYAENVHGVRSQVEFNVTVDNRVPDKPEVTLSTDRVKPGEPVTITVKAGERVQTVLVLVKRDGVLVKNLTANKAGNSFTATFEPESDGEYTFDVVVRDALGNERPVTQAASFTTTSSPIPAPDGVAALALAALGAVGLAALRRRRA